MGCGAAGIDAAKGWVVKRAEWQVRGVEIYAVVIIVGGLPSAEL